MAMGACMRQNANMRMYIGALQADNQNRMQRLIIEGNWDVRKNELFKTIQQPIFPVKMDGYKLIKEKVEKKMQLIEQVAPLPHLDKESNDYN